MSFKVLAYAKLNLALSVRRRRPDGFHDIESLVQTIDLADSIDFDVRDGVGLHVENDLEDLEGPDLAESAAAALLAAKGAARTVRIRVHKMIPAGAGLGGGSSDAAAVLRTLDELIPPALQPERLRHLASSLGSDVPLFLTGGCVRVSGRGERTERCGTSRTETFVVLVPPVHCSTPAIYAEWDRHPHRDDAPGRLVPGRNDLLAPASTIHPDLSSYARAVRALDAAFAGMSGSGSAFYAAFKAAQSAAAAASELRRTFPQARTFVCRPTPVGNRRVQEGEPV